ncbi:sensor domain-containing diguanylate cyclase [Rhizobium sp. BK251]|uniref:sensor domain-containing diguanylate cyclase n=1 Tax=Rhizobium sp. BK251 TaxID=2512125 RepID=UPI00104B8D84|nr:sensor domain-containing diguanylate cyclase [Rhizobium sp. BK251]TCL74893.1 diguanylate cyclase (GGDEF)-like protein [Rhizobium sp. BK251]
MRISTITNWAYGITVALTLLSGGAFIIAAQSADRERDAAEAAWKLDDVVERLERAAEQTTEDARLYVMKGEERFLRAFQAADAEERTREQTVKQLKAVKLTAQEIAALREIETDAELLDALEEQAVKDFEGGEADKARAALFSPEHEDAQTGLLASVAHFADLVATRTQDELREAKAKADLWGAIAKSLLVLTALVFLSVLYFVLKRRVARPLLQMSGIVQRLAKQDYDVEVLTDARRDEIGDMNEAIQVFRDNGLERERLDAERRKDQHIKDLILQLMHRLQACHEEAELGPVVSLYASQIFPRLGGHLLVMNDGRNALTTTSTWGAPVRSTQEFPSVQCWGLRRGRPHLSGDRHDDVACQHLDESGHEESLCIPLAAHGDTVGMLYFEGERDGAELIEARVYIELIAENLALAIANLQLRDRLTNLAVKDPLTGLLNRRSLDENLNRLRREDTDLPAALMMIDIDHFKHFNDEFGHDAGDFVMRQVAAIMTDVVGRAGIVHRFGGEEFAVIMRSVDKDATSNLAEAIRRAIEKAPINYLGRPLGTVTVSIGLASTADGEPPATLMLRADAALLRAKSRGRNATVADWADGSGSGRLLAG